MQAKQALQNHPKLVQGLLHQTQTSVIQLNILQTLPVDTYDPKTVFSSIDQMGRYAYCNQPVTTKWNLARFAECLIPLIDKDQDKAVKIATETINSFEKKYEEKWINMMRDKLGLFGVEDKDKFLILDLLTWMHEKKADYTNTFCP